LDKRLAFINEADSKHFPNEAEAGVKDVELQDDNFRAHGQKVRGLNLDADVKLPIVFHEREIMENIENNIVSIVCGETGSGKSTQIPKFVYKAAIQNRWKFRTSQTLKHEQSGAKKIMVGIT
jgi:HrpA-like RNA helicase